MLIKKLLQQIAYQLNINLKKLHSEN